MAVIEFTSKLPLSFAIEVFPLFNSFRLSLSCCRRSIGSLIHNPASGLFFNWPVKEQANRSDGAHGPCQF